MTAISEAVVLMAGQGSRHELRPDGQSRLGSTQAKRLVVIEADPYAAGFYARMGAQQKRTVPAPVEGDPGRALPVFEVEVKAGR